MREEDLRYLKKKYAHLLNDGNPEPSTEEEEPEEPRVYKLLTLLFSPTPIALVLLYEYFSNPPKRNVFTEIAELRIVNNISTVVRITLGICGCLLCLWALWPIWPVFIQLAASVWIMMYLLWLGCVLVFLYSLFGGRKEKKFRLAAQIILAIFGIGLTFVSLFDSFMLDHVINIEQLFQLMSGIFVVFVCLFPSTYNGKKFLASITLFYILFYILFWLWFSF